MTASAALAGRIRAGLDEIERAVQRAQELSAKAVSTGDDGYWDGVALNLHSFYTGVERIFEDIARTVDESTPGGPEWHWDLLLQMSAEVSGVRPPVITRQARHCLDEYRGFRHVVRSVYAFNLRPSRLKELVAGLAECFESVRQSLNDFAALLEQLSGPK